MSLISSSTLIV